MTVILPNNSYTLNLFPMDDPTKELYITNLTSMYPNNVINPDGSYTFYPTEDNAGIDLWTATSQEVSGTIVQLLNLGVIGRMTRDSYSIDGLEKSSSDVHYWLAPRSSIWKSGITQANSIGVIDKTYRGNLMGAVVLIDKTQTVTIPQSTRLFQVVAPNMGFISNINLLPLSAVDITSRGSGGFGSTG